ncbi:MAG: hypothetical protein Q4B28_03380 [bacterium]|nr:hypothetical protein [bacterium]
MTTTGFYVLPGKHVVESSYFKQRSRGVVNTNTTYEATKQEIEVVGSKSYRYGFDEKTESYFFEEFDPA